MVQIGVLGLGNVGSAVVDLLAKDGEGFKRQLGTGISVKKILVRDLNRTRVESAAGKLTDCAADILDDDDISLVVELMGGEEPALSYIKKALAKGKSVVTANKEVIAKHGEELAYLAHEAGVGLMFEGSVGGGIPLIRPMQTCLVANDISMVMGILNGTTNYILSRMDESGCELADALKEAQNLGYAEADPSADLSGADARRKTAILSSLAFNAHVVPQQVEACGVEKVAMTDIRYANELGYKVKLVGYGVRREDRMELCVAPVLLPLNHPLAAVRDSYNAVLVEGDAVGTLMFYGKGAGGMATASAVVGDVVEAIRSRDSVRPCFSCYDRISVEDPRLVVSPFYVRLQAVDSPGVLAFISGAFGRHGVSLSMVLQKTCKDGVAEVVLVTHSVEKGAIQDALAEIEGCSQVPEVSNYMRVWE